MTTKLPTSDEPEPDQPATACGTIASDPALSVAALLAREHEALVEARDATLECLRRLTKAELAATTAGERQALAAARESIITATHRISSADWANTIACETERACGRLRTTCEDRMEKKCGACSGRCLTKLMI